MREELQLQLSFCGVPIVITRSKKSPLYNHRMEKLLEETMDRFMEKPGVVGVMCVDKHGLCMSAKGVADPNVSGVISSMALAAHKLEPNNSVNPTIRLDSDDGYCLIQRRPQFTLAIYKRV